ncbi:kila N-domain-containing protein [Acanthamoeba polyphaga mimivirus]|uniref:Kila N-domain-containing protein n=2 Tax=Acanthamoeba polyphaga mimivirus TaxID=212035 RepID=A0A0G2YA02_MIMIV|nr:kila N-domain-containing protein [Acanthamoeba polyphaga mimivirus]AMK61716.1 hypothetical protein [Samba virus]
MQYHTKEAIEEKEKLLKKKDDKIDKLRNDIKLLLKKNDDLMEQGNEVLGYAKDTNRKITHVVKERVPYSDEPKIEHQLIIMKNNDKPVKPKKGESPKNIYDYTALRIMNKSKSATMNRYFKDHPDGETVLTIDYTPNAMHLWNQCKMELSEDKKIRQSETYSSSFNLRKGYSENKLKKDIKRIHDLRLKHPE